MPQSPIEEARHPRSPKMSYCDRSITMEHTASILSTSLNYCTRPRARAGIRNTEMNRGLEPQPRSALRAGPARNAQPAGLRTRIVSLSVRMTSRVKAVEAPIRDSPMRPPTRPQAKIRPMPRAIDRRVDVALGLRAFESVLKCAGDAPPLVLQHQGAHSFVFAKKLTTSIDRHAA